MWQVYKMDIFEQVLRDSLLKLWADVRVLHGTTRSHHVVRAVFKRSLFRFYSTSPLACLIVLYSKVVDIKCFERHLSVPFPIAAYRLLMYTCRVDNDLPIPLQFSLFVASMILTYIFYGGYTYWHAWQGPVIREITHQFIVADRDWTQ